MYMYNSIIEDCLSDHQQKINTLFSVLDRHHTKIESLKGSFKTERERIDDIECKLNRLEHLQKVHIETVGVALSRHQGSLERMEDDIEMLNDAISGLEDQQESSTPHWVSSCVCYPEEGEFCCVRQETEDSFIFSKGFHIYKGFFEIPDEDFGVKIVYCDFWSHAPCEVDYD